ncbi:MAG TPA: hypothetical protein VHV10_14360 [Ktedonobacteraceae bacterium]|nr:hypothetical protein [Ktedonobacteraceae bacterium]
MIIEEGLIAIGILALIAAIFLLRGKAKTSQTNQQAVPKQAADKQAVAFADSGSARTQSAPFSAPQVPFANQQPTAFAEPSGLAKTQAPFSAPQVPFPVYAANKPPVAFVESSGSTETLTLEEIFFPEQEQEQATPVAPTPAPEIRPIQTQVQKAEPDQTQIPVALNERLTVQPDKDLPETQTLSNTPSGVMPLSPLNPVSRSVSSSPSIDQQMAELIADTWALQQQAAELGRRLNYLSACIQHSTASASQEHESDANSKG